MSSVAVSSFSAVIFNPLRSKRAITSPVRARSKASGLTRIRVRLTAGAPLFLFGGRRLFGGAAGGAFAGARSFRLAFAGALGRDLAAALAFGGGRGRAFFPPAFRLGR